jgi:hypothetical protein
MNMKLLKQCIVTLILAAITSASWALPSPKDAAMYATMLSKIHTGGDINAPDKFGDTPLHTAVRSNFPETTDLLLDHGANPNAQNLLGDSPLHLAAEAGMVALTEKLLSKKADPGLAGASGLTPLHYAAQAGSGHKGAALFYFAGNHLSWFTHSPIRERQYLANKVIQEVSPEALRYNYPATMRLLLAAGAPVDAQDLKGWSALHYIACVGFLELAEILLLDYKADANIKNNDGLLPLHLAYSSLSRTPCKALLLPMYELLVDHTSLMNQFLYLLDCCHKLEWPDDTGMFGPVSIIRPQPVAGSTSNSSARSSASRLL